MGDRQIKSLRLTYTHCVCVCVWVGGWVCVSELLSHVQLFATPWTVAHQASLFGIFWAGKISRQPTGVGCHALLQRISPTQGQTGVSHIAGRFFTI